MSPGIHLSVMRAAEEYAERCEDEGNADLGLAGREFNGAIARDFEPPQNLRIRHI